MTEKYTILHGDSLQELKKLSDSSIDSVVTDPPYGLSKEPKIEEVLSKWLAGEPYDHGHGGFMGKSWDSFVPHPDIWREVYRVLKPGGHALVFAGTRTQDLMTISLRLAGFEVRDVIEWLYFSGFPKSHDVGKAFDKKAPRKGMFDTFAKHFAECWEQSGIKRRDLAPYFPHYKNAESIMAQMSNWKLGKNVPSKKDFEILRSLIGLSEEFSPLIERAEAEREKIGRAKGAQAKSTGRYGAWGNDDGKGISEYDITAPATDLAKQWDGWGTSLKPSHEPIIVVRKPLIDADTGRKLTVADCVEKYGTGAININASRIGTTREVPRSHSRSKSNIGATGISEKRLPSELNPNIGRFPANCITLDSDEFYSKYFNVANVTPAELSKKASKKDRNSDWQGEEIKHESSAEMRFVSASGSGQMLPSKSAGLESRKAKGNFHPTVKPTDLMAWLVRLVTPPEGTVLDPFAGSGSTLVAAKRDGFGFVGVELTDEYIPIIEARTGEKAQESEEKAGEPKEEALV